MRTEKRKEKKRGMATTKPHKFQSNHCLPLNEPLILKIPLESIVCYNFYFRGWYYFVEAERLTDWTELQRIKLGTSESGSKRLCKALPCIFVTFSVPVEISSDGV